MSSKHTPGPWSVRESLELTGFFYIESEHGDVVYLSGALQPGYNAANARLIAAAPTMYAFIEREANDDNAEAIAILEAINGHS